ncbi:regulatory GntR family protein [Halopolyspora algeriensis]|uniref:Regulatory GntR family protein n=1 Tax=Halopolyspora algeriensis TaxID=1500506 RepID=A0A368VT14_9ACTN|nr:tyrosine-type recombinase/integrase [Halopolyspora algeriensis]RCW45120.1 regulatory GntR family protein [Halopolyspora algeriensis]TQM53158.1 regulatory GntR family protein [Halopolyspora algeriensis]
MAGRSKGHHRRGAIDRLPNGSLRVRVSAGLDPVTKKRHRLVEVVPSGPDAEAEAERVRTRLLNEVDERRNPKTNATVEQLLERYLEQHFDGEATTLNGYRRAARKHVLPFLGQVKVGQLDADALDSLYAELRRCRDHCTGKRRIDHRTRRHHECDERCRPHRCVPLGPTAIRQIHYLLSGAFKRAVRWKWVAVNPVGQAEPPAAPRPEPNPPSTAEAVRILNEAWRTDEDWGALVWTAMTTGARRGELCGLRWDHIDLEAAVLRLTQSVAYDERNKHWYVKGTKTHQQRRIALDAETVTVLASLHSRHEQRAGQFGLVPAPDAYVFSPDPDGACFLHPDTVTQRYERMARRLGIHTTLHKLRHYSATELIASGVDPRTVAGRLGHGGGGTTTLKVYSAWVSEADQRASQALFSRVPTRPEGPQSRQERAKTAPESPYERIAADLRAKIASGELVGGAPLPRVKKLMADYGVSAGTANRAVSLLKTWGLAEAARGRPTTVLPGAAERLATEEPAPQAVTTPAKSAITSDNAPPSSEPVLLEFEVRRLGESIRTFTAEADPTNPEHLRRLLASTIRRDGRDSGEVLDYEMDVRSSSGELLTTFVTISA